MPRCAACGHAFVAASALAEADGDPFLGKTVAARYVILARLGAGSMGTVYKARHEAMARDVAVKILRAERLRDAYAKARFVREARAMSMLASPHTVTVFDFGEIHIGDSVLYDRASTLPPPPQQTQSDSLGEEIEEDARSLYLAMELLEGESLGQRLRRAPRLDVEQAARVARQALLSLEEAHEKGVIHRDLKPDNLFLAKAASGERGEICKVLDFGIAKVVSDRSRPVDALETQAGTVFGTPRYMSPEQAQGRQLDARSDLYTLGLLLYQMVAGRPPFVDEDAVVVMAHHIKTAPKPPSVVAPDARVPRALSDLILRALSKDPAERPASARAFITELDQALEAAKLEAAQTPAPRSAAVSSSPSISPASPKRSSVTPTPQRPATLPPLSTPPPTSTPTPRARSSTPPPARASSSGSNPPIRATPTGSNPPARPSSPGAADSSGSSAALRRSSSAPPASGPVSTPPPTQPSATALALQPPRAVADRVEVISPQPRRDAADLIPASNPPRSTRAKVTTALVIAGGVLVGVLGGALAFRLLH